MLIDSSLSMDLASEKFLSIRKSLENQAAQYIILNTLVIRAIDNLKQQFDQQPQALDASMTSPTIITPTALLTTKDQKASFAVTRT